MDHPTHPRRSRRLATLRGGSASLLLLILVSGSTFAACSDAHPAGTDAAALAMPTMDGDVPTVQPPAVDAPAAPAEGPVAAQDAMWAARPAYVGTSAATEAAYHYAVTHPEIVQWMPCYCGCDGMGHGSNLDCYIKPADGTFEEHASYCDICVKITLTTKALVEEGRSLRDIRQVIDQTFGGSIPGTPTELPPV